MRLGPGVRPGPRRQARWADRDIQGQASAHLVPALTSLCPALTITGGQLLSTSYTERPIMKLTFLGKDSTPNDSPTLYATDRDTYLV